MLTTPYSFESLREEIARQDFAVVPFAIPRSQIDQTIAAFFEFLRLPQEMKASLYFKLNPDDRGTEVGYRKREKSLGDLDEREYFHYNEYVDRFGEAANSDPVLKNFLEQADAIYQEAKRSMSDVLSAFDSAFPGLHKKFFPEGARPRFFLRFLKYSPVSVGDFLAKGHYDRGACTLAIAESAPGLRLGKNDQSLAEVEHREQQAIFMPGLRFPTLTSSEFHPVWHDVIQKSENQFSPDAARWALVFFCDPAMLDVISFEEAHTPLYT